MLAIALRLSLLCELLIYGVFASRALSLAPAASALAACAVLLGLRAGIIAVTYVFAYAAHSPAPRLGLVRAGAMAFREYLAFLVLFLLIQPFERQWMGQDNVRPGRPLLILIHGYGCNRGAWWWLRRRLEAAGFAVATLNLEPVYADIDSYVARLAERIASACRDNACDKVTLVGHSMGGLVARAYLAKFGATHVRQLVTIATPHAGSVLARLGMGRNARQMEPGSPWLGALWRGGMPIPVASIRNSHDNFVMPQDNQRLPAAADLELPATGHLAVLFSDVAAEMLLAVLNERA